MRLTEWVFRSLLLGILLELFFLHETDAFHCHKGSGFPRLFSSSTRLSAADDSVDETTISLRRRRQKRRKSTGRRPKYYWTNPSNMKRELRQFWKDCGVKLGSQQPIVIPNETLLRYYGRHDIRAAIASQGGRQVLSKVLGEVRIMPGRWKEAVQQSIEVQQLVRSDDNLSADRPPPLTHYKADGDSSGRWKHQSGRKPKGYWDLRRIVEELYEYVEDYRTRHGRPAVWMPRPTELATHGRDDLRQALDRFGGTAKIRRTAGMVPYREWYYFEGQLELFVLLKRYLDEYENSDYTTFPCVSEIRRKPGYLQLHSLIQYYGGRKFLASRLSMAHSNIPKPVRDDDFADMYWGPFDLDFAVRLLLFVRQDQLLKNPPMKNPVIYMPSQTKLLSSGSEGVWLNDKIQAFGGYENVARRLGLAFFD